MRLKKQTNRNKQTKTDRKFLKVACLSNEVLTLTERVTHTYSKLNSYFCGIRSCGFFSHQLINSYRSLWKFYPNLQLEKMLTLSRCFLGCDGQESSKASTSNASSRRWESCWINPTRNLCQQCSVWFPGVPPQQWWLLYAPWVILCTHIPLTCGVEALWEQ